METNLLHTEILDTSYDIDKILAEIAMLPKFDRQLYLQTDKLETDVYSPGAWKNIDAIEHTFTVPVFYNIPYINNIINDLKLVRTRILVLPGRTNYLWHKDNTKRLHIPLITNPHCFFIFEDGIVHFPADGRCYIADTRKYHNAMNSSVDTRIHIVGAIL